MRYAEMASRFHHRNRPSAAESNRMVFRLHSRAKPVTVQLRLKPFMRPSDSPQQAAAATPSHHQAELARSALENLFEVSPDAIFVTDAEGIIRGANPRAAELFGHTQAELVGQPIENLVPARFRSRHPSHRENYNAHPGPAKWARP